MSKLTRALFCALLVVALLGPISGRRISGGRSGGRSGGGHSYPSSHSGLSGTGSRHSGGLSGGGHGYPSSGGSHTYPSPSHTYPSSGGSHTYPSSGGSHSYPSNNRGGLSGNQGSGTHSYPSGGGLSGNNNNPNRVIISVCWVAGAGVGLLPLFGWHAAESAPGCYFVDVMDYNYLVFLYFATIVTPSVLLAAFYAHIYRVVVKQLSAVVTVDGSGGRLGGGRLAGGTMLRVLGAAQKREVKATQNLAIIVFFFIVCWIPLYTINAVKAFKPDLDIPNLLTYFCVIFSHLNSAINPLLYAYHLKDFRAALRGLLCSIIGRGVVPIPAAYRPPVPMRRPALERCNALRERPKIYVNSPVWLRQREAETGEGLPSPEGKANTTASNVLEAEPFLNRNATDSSSGRHTPEGRESDGPYLINSNEEKCQSPYKRVEDFLRRVRSANSVS